MPNFLVGRDPGDEHEDRPPLRAEVELDEQAGPLEAEDEEQE